jgi:hypothetical protein
MRTLIFSTLFLLSSFVTFAQSNKVYFCVQVCSTENPHLLKPDMVSLFSADTAMVELAVIENRMLSRILFVYETKEEQIAAHQNWLRYWPDAIIFTRTERQFRNLFKLFKSTADEN